MPPPSWKTIITLAAGFLLLKDGYLHGFVLKPWFWEEGMNLGLISSHNPHFQNVTPPSCIMKIHPLSWGGFIISRGDQCGLHMEKNYYETLLKTFFFN